MDRSRLRLPDLQTRLGRSHLGIARLPARGRGARPGVGAGTSTQAMRERRRWHGMSGFTPADHLDFLLSAVYDGPTRLDHPEHVADLRKSGLAAMTIRLQKLTDVPPHMIDQLLGFETPKIRSAYL